MYFDWIWINNNSNNNNKLIIIKAILHLAMLQVAFFKPFSAGMDLDFYIFLATAKSQKNIKYVF